jgi:hypothetical protein
MQIFRTTRAYVIAFCAYAFNALSSLHHLLSASGQRVTRTPSSSQYPVLAAMLVCALILPGFVGKTSNPLERIVILLTEVVIVLGLINVLPEYGLTWAVIPLERYLSASAVFAAAVFAGVRLFVVVRQRGGERV